MVGVTGIEPATSGPPALRSTTELHPAYAKAPAGKPALTLLKPFNIVLYLARETIASCNPAIIAL